MPRHHKHTIGKPFRSPDQIEPIDPDEFDTALNWAMNAASRKAVVTDPSKMGLNLDLGNGRVEHIGFTDIPMNRALMALKERYGDSEKMFFVSMRIFALFQIMHDPAMTKWMRQGGEFTEVHPAVTEAAATIMLNNDGNFPVDIFFAKVEELSKTKYKDEDLSPPYTPSE